MVTLVKSVGMREFKNRFGEIIREMEETGEEVTVTRRGREVFRAVPPKPRQMTDEEVEAWIKRSKELAKEIGKLWPKGVSAAQAISEDRSRLERH